MGWSEAHVPCVESGEDALALWLARSGSQADAWMLMREEEKLEDATIWGVIVSTTNQYPFSSHNSRCTSRRTGNRN